MLLHGVWCLLIGALLMQVRCFEKHWTCSVGHLLLQQYCEDLNAVRPMPTSLAIPCPFGWMLETIATAACIKMAEALITKTHRPHAAASLPVIITVFIRTILPVS